MVTDQEPRYRLVDADGNVVGSLFAESDGTLKLQEGTSGSDNEFAVETDGTANTPRVSFSGLTKGTLGNLTFAEPIAGTQVEENVQFTDGVDTTPTVIWSRASEGDAAIAYRLDVLVRSAAGDFVLDSVSVTDLGQAVKGISATRGSPPTTTYTQDGNGNVELELGSGTANCAVWGRGLNTDAP